MSTPESEETRATDAASDFTPTENEHHICPRCGGWVPDLTKPDWYCEGCGLSYYGDEEMAGWVARYRVAEAAAAALHQPPDADEIEAVKRAMLDEFPAWPTLALRSHALARVAAAALRPPREGAGGDAHTQDEWASLRRELDSVAEERDVYRQACGRTREGLQTDLDATEAALAESRGEVERLATALEDIANRSTGCRVPGCVREFCEHYIAGISPHDFAMQVISEAPHEST